MYAVMMPRGCCGACHTSEMREEEMVDSVGTLRPRGGDSRVSNVIDDPWEQPTAVHATSTNEYDVNGSRLLITAFWEFPAPAYTTFELPEPAAISIRYDVMNPFGAAGRDHMMLRAEDMAETSCTAGTPAGAASRVVKGTGPTVALPAELMAAR